jgi:hypothetical protein
MKTNYESKRSEESRKIIQIIGSYAEKNSKRTKEKRTTYTSILERCIQDLATYGIERD